MNLFIFTNPNLVEAAREWLWKSSMVSDYERDAMTDSQILATIERHYDGGLAQFTQDWRATE